MLLELPSSLRAAVAAWSAGTRSDTRMEVEQEGEAGEDPCQGTCLLNALCCHADCRFSSARQLAQGSTQVSGCVGHAAHAVLEEARHSSSFPSVPGCCHQPSKSGKLGVRWVCVVLVAGGCCHQCLFWEAFFPFLLCDPHRSVIKRRKPRKRSVGTETLPWPALRGYRPQPKQPSEGQVK